MKKLCMLALALAVTISLCGCFDIPPKEKTFTVEGVSIVLNDDFFKMNQVAPEYDFCISSDDIVIFGLRVNTQEGDLQNVSAEEYATAFSGAMDRETEMTQLDGRPLVRYYAEDADGDLQIVNIVFYQGDACLWLLSFISDADDFAEEQPQIRQYANSVTFG